MILEWFQSFTIKYIVVKDKKIKSTLHCKSLVIHVLVSLSLGTIYWYAIVIVVFSGKSYL